MTYFSEADISQSAVLFDLSGKFENLQTQDNVKMALIFESKGKIVSKPESISLTIYHFSMGENAIFKTNHNLSITINGTQVLSNDLLLSASRQLDPAGRYEEDYRKSIPYQTLKKMAESEQVKIKFGDKEIYLDTSQLEAISDLNRTIEK